jgi:2-polyprenyl-3-methyl-5-hydroxy-6-metoxy-1,4-benzoquinol methylase
LEYVAGKTVGDVACGCGYGADLMTNVATEVLGVDISSEAISYAYDHYPSLDHLIQMDLEKPINLDSKVDVMVSFETIEHLSSPEEFFEWVKGNTKELFVGSIPISCPTEFHKVNYTSGQIYKLIQENFKNPTFYYQNDMEIIPASSYQFFPSGMILFKGGVK